MQRKRVWLFVLIAAIAVWFGQIPQVQAATLWEKRVMHVIHDHPEIVIQALEAYEAQQATQRYAQQEQAVKSLTTHAAQIWKQSPHTGSATPELYLIEFSDFQCPFCREAQLKLPAVLKQHPEIGLIYKNLPLSMLHSASFSAARAAWAAYRQNKFWQFHDALFSAQSDLNLTLYQKVAETLDLDVEQFERDQVAPETNAAIEKDITLANALGIQGTPFFVITDGTHLQTVAGADFASIETAISHVLAAS